MQLFINVGLLFIMLLLQSADRDRENATGPMSIIWCRACERSVSGAWAERQRSGNGAVSASPVNGAERWAGNFAAPLTCSDLVWNIYRTTSVKLNLLSFFTFSSTPTYFFLCKQLKLH